MKRRLVYMLPVVSVLLISSALIAFYMLDADSLKASEKKKKELDELFDGLGVVKFPHPSEPVEIRLKDLDGSVIRLSDFRGKIVFLNFWTTWCPSCRQEMPSMESLHQRFKNHDFAMISINLKESAAQVRGFFNRFKLSFSALLDTTGEVSVDFGIRSIPTTFILDRNGSIIGGVMGSREWDGEDAVALFERLTS